MTDERETTDAREMADEREMAEEVEWAVRRKQRRWPDLIEWVEEGELGDE